MVFNGLTYRRSLVQVQLGPPMNLRGWTLCPALFLPFQEREVMVKESAVKICLDFFTELIY